MAALKQISSHLMEEEEIICDQPPGQVPFLPVVGSEKVTPLGVVFTNRRIIFYKPKLLGMDLKDFTWHDLREININEGLLGSEIIFVMKDNYTCPIGNRDKDQIRKLYSLAVELKAKILEPQATALQGPVSTSHNPVEKLRQLKDMLDSGLISQAEYEAKKADILSRM